MLEVIEDLLAKGCLCESRNKIREIERTACQAHLKGPVGTTSLEVASPAGDLTSSAHLIQPLPKNLLFVGYRVSQFFPLAFFTVRLKYLVQGNLYLDASLLPISLVSV